MTSQILVKNGLEAGRLAITPAVGELLWVKDTESVYVGNGVIAGGIKIGSSGGIGDFIPLTQKGAADGVATLGPDGLVPNSQIPALAISSTFVAVDEAAHLALTGVEEGDVVVRTDENKSYIHNGGVAGTMADYQELLSPTESVSSVNGQVGVVVLTSDEVAEGSTNLYYDQTTVDNSISTALAALNINDLGDVDTATNAPTADQILSWDGTNWTPVDITAPTLTDLIDDTKGVGDTDFAWSADKIATEMLIVDGGTF